MALIQVDDDGLKSTDPSLGKCTKNRLENEGFSIAGRILISSRFGGILEAGFHIDLDLLILKGNGMKQRYFEPLILVSVHNKHTYM